MERRVCNKCDLEKDLTEFPFRNKAKGKRDGRCRSCKKNDSLAHYHANSEAYKRRASAFRKVVVAENSLKVAEYLRAHPCMDCGESDIVVLQFDHRRDKIDSVSNLVRSGCCWDTIEQEISKCDVRCSNCHIRRTASSFGWRWRLQRRGGTEPIPGS
jgi:hypothetical protein